MRINLLILFIYHVPFNFFYRKVINKSQATQTSNQTQTKQNPRVGGVGGVV